MISREEIENKAREFKIGLADVEKDYIYGWVLNQISHSPLAGELILKGGGCLRKAYLPETRFSKDMDFSSTTSLDGAVLRRELNQICDDVQAQTGVQFLTEQTRIRDKPLPIPEVHAMEARLYFKGFYGEEEIILKAQLDLTEFDRIFLPVQERQLIHPYSDARECSATIRCQKLEEVLASKLTTLLHRRRSGDLFDLIYSVLIAKDYPVSRREVITTFLRKSIFESQPVIAKNELLSVPLEEFRSLWGAVLAPIRSVLSFEFVLNNFATVVESLFASIVEVAPSGVAAGPRLGGSRGTGGIRPLSIRSFQSFSYFPRLHRNTIIDSGRGHTLIRLMYDGISRLIEPYKLEYYVRKKDGHGLEYLWGYDPVGGGRSGTPGIRRFICDKIQQVDATSSSFIPRFEMEL